MRVGKLDQRIVLQSLSETNDGGELTQVWTTVATVWAHVISQRGQEAFEAARNNASETVRVMIRYRSDITSKWRFQWKSQNYNIIHVDRSNERDGELWMTAEVSGAI